MITYDVLKTELNKLRFYWEETDIKEEVLSFLLLKRKIMKLVHKHRAGRCEVVFTYIKKRVLVNSKTQYKLTEEGSKLKEILLSHNKE